MFDSLDLLVLIYPTVAFSGKGDLVGCDISLNLLHNGQLTGGGGQGGQDFILKSSSDVKVGQSILIISQERRKEN